MPVILTSPYSEVTLPLAGQIDGMSGSAIIPVNIYSSVNSKTVTRTLNSEQAKLVKGCIDNMRKLEKILDQMKDLSVQYVIFTGE